MKSLILFTATQYLLPLMLLLSVYLLFSGHHAPGGGFVGGLVASAAFSLYSLAHGAPAARSVFYFNPTILSGIGLALAVICGCIPLLMDKPFLTGLWSDFQIPVLKKVGTPLLFDAGVYMVVVGVTLTIIFSLEED